MSGLGVLLIFLLVSSITAIAVFIWFRLIRYPFSLLRFSIVLLVGAASVFPALLLLSVIPDRAWFIKTAGGRWAGAAMFFARAFTEELSRLLLLVPLIFAFRRLNSAAQPEQSTHSGTAISDLSMAGAAGLVAGFGFAIMESAVLGTSNPAIYVFYNLLLRAFTTAPLHGACGFRVGTSVGIFRENPARGISLFFSAVVIHGVYNFLLRIPGALPSIAAVFIALSAFVTAIMAIRKEKPSALHPKSQL